MFPLEWKSGLFTILNRNAIYIERSHQLITLKKQQEPGSGIMLNSADCFFTDIVFSVLSGWTVWDSTTSYVLKPKSPSGGNAI